MQETPPTELPEHATKDIFSVTTCKVEGYGQKLVDRAAVAMVALIAHRINGAWDEFWATRPLQRAA